MLAYATGDPAVSPYNQFLTSATQLYVCTSWWWAILTHEVEVIIKRMTANFDVVDLGSNKLNTILVTVIVEHDHLLDYPWAGDMKMDHVQLI